MKRIISIAAVLFLLAAVPIQAAGPFSDVRQTDWYASFAQTAKDLGILSGYPDGTFRPDLQVTYGEFLAMAMRGKASAETTGGHWAYGFYASAADAGIFDGPEISSRALDEPIPRQDMALVMAGLLREAGLGGVNAMRADRRFTDVAATDEREYAIALCAYYGVLSGYPDGTFRPLGFLKRSEAASAMVSLAEKLASDEAQTPSEEAPQAAPDPVKTGPSAREDLLALEEGQAYVKTGDENVLDFMDARARTWLQQVIADARFVREDGAYLVRLTWPAMPEGYGGKIDVQVCNANGTGLDGKVWVCRKGMEKVPIYTEALRADGGTQYVFELKDLSSAGSVDLLLSLTAEDGSGESSLALARQDLSTGSCTVQYKVASDSYHVSGTLPLEAGVFLWK